MSKNNYTKLSVEERFAARVIPIQGTDCWKWNGSWSFRVNGKNISPSRFSYELKKGQIPKDAKLYKTCKTTDCVNPEHHSVVCGATLKELLKDQGRYGAEVQRKNRLERERKEQQESLISFDRIDTKDLKFDDGKPRPSLLPAKALLAVCEVLEFGAKKYEAHSWQNVQNARQRYTDALLRHQLAVQNGEHYDSETGLPHSYHVACNALFVAHFDALEEEQNDEVDAAIAKARMSDSSYDMTRFVEVEDLLFV